MTLTLAAEREDIETWPVNFSAWTRELIIARDTPAGLGRPLCTVCGQPVTGRVIHIHHVLTRERRGRGRPSNGIVVHGEEQAGGCHITRIHKQGAAAQANGWLRSRHAAKPGVYASPVLCAWRGLVVLDDAGGWGAA